MSYDSKTNTKAKDTNSFGIVSQKKADQNLLSQRSSNYYQILKGKAEKWIIYQKENGKSPHHIAQSKGHSNDAKWLLFSATPVETQIYKLSCDLQDQTTKKPAHTYVASKIDETKEPHHSTQGGWFFTTSETQNFTSLSISISKETFKNDFKLILYLSFLSGVQGLKSFYRHVSPSNATYFMMFEIIYIWYTIFDMYHQTQLHQGLIFWTNVLPSTGFIFSFKIISFFFITSSIEGFRCLSLPAVLKNSTLCQVLFSIFCGYQIKKLVLLP